MLQHAIEWGKNAEAIPVMMCMRAAVLEYLLDPGGHQCHKPHATAQVPNYLPLPKCKKTSQIMFEGAGVSMTE